MIAKNLNEIYGTLSETLNELLKLGYTHDFNIKEECIVCDKSNISLSPEEFKIDQVYRFEGDSDPEYQAVLYAISSEKFNLKGTLVNGYGLSADETSSKLIEKLETHQKTNNIVENKSSNATPLRPDGERMLNGPLVELDINESIQKIKSEATWNKSDRNSMTLFKSESMTIVLIGLHAHAELKPHKAKGPICVQIVMGKIEFGAAEQITQLNQGQMIVLRENITHHVKALEESFFILTHLNR